nr:aldo/keto reductase [Kribbella sp. VKM Ac-2568]
MEYRRTGNSGLDLPALSLGLWQKFGTDYPFETQREILLHAFDLGVTHFDNANRYGPPRRGAEKVFGRVLRSDLAPYRDELILTTKAGNPIGPSPYLKGGSRKSLLVSLEHSLRDLGTDYVDIFYHHRPDLSTPVEETVGALVSAVQKARLCTSACPTIRPSARTTWPSCCAGPGCLCWCTSRGTRSSTAGPSTPGCSSWRPRTASDSLPTAPWLRAC